MSSFRLAHQKTQTISLISIRTTRKVLLFSEERTFSNYRKIIESITTRHGVVLVFKIKNNKMTLFKKIESKNNLRQDVRNTLSFRTKILPLLLEDPKINFIIQYAHAC